jgi:hypothetical protein
VKKLIFLLLVALLAWKLFADPGEVALGPGVMAKEPPTQINIDNPTSFEFGKHKITPLAKFRIKAKVLSREDYSYDKESDVSPVDLALGWGRMSDESVIEKIEISQSGRWYRWHTKTLPIPKREIETHSANMHMIPADDVVEDEIKRTRKGDIIELEGYLVEVKSDDGRRWKSSLTREDTGNHACEVIWVEQFEVVMDPL